MDTEKDHPKLDSRKIKKRANEIWKRKCQSLNTALDDWLQAERELKTQAGIGNKEPGQYTSAEVTRIRKRAQAIRDGKIQLLRTAFDDWIEAEKELAEELKNKKIDLHALFDLWFKKASPRVDSLLNEGAEFHRSIFDEALGQEYVELMADCMK